MHQLDQPTSLALQAADMLVGKLTKAEEQSSRTLTAYLVPGLHFESVDLNVFMY